MTGRDRVTGGGTAGIDFAPVLLARLLGGDVARMTRLALGHDPAPPYDTGGPRKAGDKLARVVQVWVGPLGHTFATTCEAAAKDAGHYASTG